MAQNGLNIDDLQIKIGIEASQAASGLRTLAQGLRNTASEASKAAKELQDAANGVKKGTASATQDTEKLGNSLQKMVANVTKVAKKLPDAFGNVTKTIGGLFNTIKRVAFIRLIRSAIKGITTSIKEGTQALIEWDRAYGRNTSFAAKTADEIAAKWGEVKKSFGAAAMPLIQMVQPALMSVMNAVISVVNGINMAFRSLQGFSTYMKATTQTIGAGIDNATGKAKELQRVLFGFDELNVLPSLNGGGGGASSSNASPIDFVETAIDDAKASTFRSILELVKSIGKAFLAWKLSKAFLSGLGLANEKTTGLSLAIAGALTSFYELKDQLNNGVNWVNLTGLVSGLATTTAGLGIAFGKAGTTIGLFVSGITLAIAPLKELFNTGTLTAQSLTQLSLSILAVSSGISLLTGNIIPLLAGGLLAGMITATKQMKDDWTEMQNALEIEKYGDTISNITGKIDDQIRALRERREEILNSKSASEAELEYADHLITKYLELSKKEKLTADEKERMAAYSDELLAIYPDLNKYLDEETGILTITEEQWRKIYDAKLKDIKLEARREKIIELEKQQLDTELAIADATKQETKAHEVWQDSINRKNNLPALIEQLQQIHEKIVLANDSTETLTESEKALLDEYTNGTGKVTDLKNAIIDLYKEQDKADENIANAKSVYDDLAQKVKDLQGDYEQTGETIKLVSQGIYDDITSSVKNIKNDVPTLEIPVKATGIGLNNSVSNIYKVMANALKNNSLIMPVVATNAPNIDNEITRRQNNISAIRFYASGGVPDVGTLYYAGESGSEIVANMSHGTGVMNVSQMQEAVANGNIEVVNAVYAMANMVAGAVNNKNFDVYMDTQKVGQSVSRYQYNQARRGVPQGAI